MSIGRLRGCDIVLLDRRESPELETLVRTLGVECKTTELQFGDCCFESIDGRLVGFERKRLSDLINSMKDRRLSGHQLRGCWEAYDHVYLVSEGIYREGDGGEIEEMRWDHLAKKNVWAPFYSNGRVGDRGAVSYEQLDHYLTTLELGPSSGGRRRVIVHRTKDARATARLYVSKWRWFQKRWEDHHADDVLYLGLPAKAHGSQWGDAHGHDEDYAAPGRGRVALTQENPTTCWRWAACLPGIDRKAEIVAKHFKTARAMVEADEKEWQTIDFGTRPDGKRNPGVGPVTAAAVVRAINEEGA